MKRVIGEGMCIVKENIDTVMNRDALFAEKELLRYRELTCYHCYNMGDYCKGILNILSSTYTYNMYLRCYIGKEELMLNESLPTVIVDLICDYVK